MTGFATLHKANAHMGDTPENNFVVVLSRLEDGLELKL